MTPQERLTGTALAQVGYLGKRSSAQLDSSTGNGGGKYNKFARDLDALKSFYNGPKQGFDWCDVFVDWCFVQTFGRALAQKLLCQPDRSCGAGTAYSLNYYKRRGQFHTADPQPGDQIFFGDAGHTWHTGIVTDVSSGSVSTVEGNAGSPLGVHKFRYPLTYKAIKGYGRPDWTLAADAQTAPGENVPSSGTASGGTVPGSGTTSAAPVLQIGDVVDFRGTRHYGSSDAARASACRPGAAQVTAVSARAKHPYHLVGTGTCTVYGWVDAGDIAG